MPDQKRTEFAMKALGLAELFNIMVGKEPLAGDVRYRAELSAPDGPSTGGGAQAVQHIKLVPEGGGATIVAGSANQVEKTSELRTFAHLEALHAQRFRGAALPLDRTAYEELARKIQAFFTQQGLRFVMVDAPRPPGQPAAPAAPAAAATTAKNPLVIALGAGVAVLLLALVFLLLHRHR